MRYLCLFLLLASCETSLPAVTHDPLTAQDQITIDAVQDAWNLEGRLPVLNSFDRVLVTDAATPEIFHNLCRVCGPSATDPDCTITWGSPPTVLRANACTTSDNRCEGPFCGLFTDSVTLLVIFPAHPRRTVLVIHEAVHVAGGRAGIGMDPFHLDPLRWCDYSQGGCSGSSVEYRTRLLVE